MSVHLWDPMHDPSTCLAVFRVEGVLVRRTSLGCAARMATEGQGWSGRFGELARVGLAAAAQRTSALSHEAALRSAWRALGGWSEDRLAVLAETYAADQVASAWNEAGWGLLQRCREAGDTVVLLSDHPRPFLQSVVDRARPDHVVCNELVASNGRLTGNLRTPVVTGAGDGAWLRRWAEQHHHSPLRIRAYGACEHDATLLAGAPLPCAVTPDRTLRGLARTHSWPVVDA